MARALNIAHCVESYAPGVGGMPEVVKQLSERIVRLGHHVTVLTSAHPSRSFTELNGVKIRSFDLRGNLVNGIVGDQEAYFNTLRNGGFDVVTLFAAQQWSADAVLPRLTELSAKKVFVPTGFSALHDPKYTDYFKRMAGWMRQFDLNVFPASDYQDMRFANEHGIANVAVIPNGASQEEFESNTGSDVRAASGIGREQRVVLHVGSFTGIKGHKEAVRMFVGANTRNAVLVLVGNGVARLRRIFQYHWRYQGLHAVAMLKGKRILFLELDRADTVTAMKQADLFLFPSNVECSPIVLFEAMAAGVPFLASRAGNSEEIASWSHGGWTIPGTRDQADREVVDVKAGARMLNALLADPKKMHDAGTRGHSAWKERFTWQRIAEQYLEHYQRIAAQPHA